MASNAYVHTEGDIEDVLFSMPPHGRDLRENDLFLHVDTAGVETTYKIESVLPRFEQLSVQDGTPSVIWRPPAVYYGVSVVP
jgi:hypothetical protein